MRDEDIARSLQIGSATVERVRRRCVEEGIEAALGRREQLNRRQKKLDGSGEAHLTLWPVGNLRGPGRLTLKLLADRLRGKRDSGEHQQGDGAPDAEKNQLKPWLKECWCIPSQGQRRVRLRYGGRAGGLSPSV